MLCSAETIGLLFKGVVCGSGRSVVDEFLPWVLCCFVLFVVVFGSCFTTSWGGVFWVVFGVLVVSAVVLVVACSGECYFFCCLFSFLAWFLWSCGFLVLCWLCFLLFFVLVL